MEIVQKLQQLSEVMTQDGLTVDALRAAVEKAGPDGNARVVAVPGTTEPAHVSLALPQKLLLSWLKEAFGEPHPAPQLHPDSPRETLFYPVPTLGTDYRCAVIARLVAGDEQSVGQITLRRDPQ